MFFGTAFDEGQAMMQQSRFGPLVHLVLHNQVPRAGFGGLDSTWGFHAEVKQEWKLVPSPPVSDPLHWEVRESPLGGFEFFNNQSAYNDVFGEPFIIYCTPLACELSGGEGYFVNPQVSIQDYIGRIKGEPSGRNRGDYPPADLRLEKVLEDFDVFRAQFCKVVALERSSDRVCNR